MSTSDSARVLSLVAGDWIILDEAHPIAPAGAFGSVYRGESSDGVPVAIKILRANENQYFRRELSIGTLLLNQQFQYVVPILDVGYDAELQEYALVMPLAQGNLHDKVARDGSMNETTAAAVLSDIVRGLAELAPHLVHRDLKPENILLHEGRWKIADFSTSRLIASITSSMTTRPWLSAYYAAPEQWKLEEATTATDIYAIGCVAYFIVVGHPPYDGHVDELRIKHCDAPTPRPPGASDRYELIVEGCMRKRPPDRPAIAQLHRWIELIGDDSSHPSVGANALAKVVAKVVHEHSEKEVKDRRGQVTAAQRAEFLKAATKAAINIRESLFAELLELVPGARRENIKKPQDSGGSLGDLLSGPPSSNTKKDRTLLIVANAVVEMSDFSDDMFLNSRTGAPIPSCRLVVSRRDLDVRQGERVWRSKIRVDRLLLYRQLDNEEFRWREHCAFPPVAKQIQPVPPVPDPQPAWTWRRWRRTVVPPASTTNPAEEEREPLMWDGRVLEEVGVPIDDDAIGDFIDRWLLLVAKAMEDSLGEVADAVLGAYTVWDTLGPFDPRGLFGPRE